MYLKGQPSPTSSDSSESSPWKAAGKACADYFSALALRDDGRQEHGARQVCQRESQRIRGGVKTVWARRCSSAGAAWERHGSGVKVAWGLRGGVVRAALARVATMWGRRENGVEVVLGAARMAFE